MRRVKGIKIFTVINRTSLNQYYSKEVAFVVAGVVTSVSGVNTGLDCNKWYFISTTYQYIYHSM